MMTDLMQSIFEHIQEKNYTGFLSSAYWNSMDLLVRQEDALLETFTDAQQKLLETYQRTQAQTHSLELQAAFQAAWAAARELS